MKKLINEVKAIRFQVAFNGNGCVNYDSISQLGTLKETGIYSEDEEEIKRKKKKGKNKMLAKKEFGYDENKETGFKYKVSSECLRHTMFRKTMPCVNALPNTDRNLVDRMHAQPDYILRGYMTTFGKKETAIRRKSPFTITDAVECNSTYRKFVDFDFHSNAGEKDNQKNGLCDNENDGNDNNENETNSTSLYHIENVGKLVYVADANLDVEELQFISCDQKYDRQAFDNERYGRNENPYLLELAKTMLNFTPEVKQYVLDNDIAQIDEDMYKIGEYGVLLNKESVNMLIHRMFNLIKNLNIYKRNALFEFAKFMSIKVVTTDGIVEIRPDEIDDIYFEYAEAYKPLQ